METDTLRSVVDEILLHDKSFAPKRNEAYVSSKMLKASNGKPYNVLVEVWPTKEGNNVSEIQKTT